MGEGGGWPAVAARAEQAVALLTGRGALWSRNRSSSSWTWGTGTTRAGGAAGLVAPTEGADGRESGWAKRAQPGTGTGTLRQQVSHANSLDVSGRERYIAPGTGAGRRGEAGGGGGEGGWDLSRLGASSELPPPLPLARWLGGIDLGRRTKLEQGPEEE